MSYGDKITAVRCALIRQGIQMTAGRAREEGGRYAGGRAAGGSKPLAIPSKQSAALAVLDTHGDLDAAKAMLAGLTDEERAACDAQLDAERRWEAGEGDRGEIRRQAGRADEKLRRAIKAREEAGEEGGPGAMTPLGYMQRVMRRGGATHTIKAYPYGFGRSFHFEEEGGRFQR